MNLLKIFLLIVLASNTAWGARRVDPKDLSGENSGRRERPELTPRIESLRSELGAIAKSIIGPRLMGERFQVILPRNIRGQESKYETEMAELVRVLKEGREEFKNESPKAKDMANLLKDINDLYAQRGDISNKVENGNLQGKELEAAKDVLDLIDNALTLLIVKMTESIENPVSADQMSRVFQLISRFDTAGARGKDFIDLEAQISAILPRGYNLRKAARCIR